MRIGGPSTVVSGTSCQSLCSSVPFLVLVLFASLLLGDKCGLVLGPHCTRGGMGLLSFVHPKVVRSTFLLGICPFF